MKSIHILHHSMSLFADQIPDQNILHCTTGIPPLFARAIKKRYPDAELEYWRPERKVKQNHTWRDSDGILHRLFPSICLRFNWEFSSNLLKSIRVLPNEKDTYIWFHGIYNLHAYLSAPLLKGRRAIAQSHGGLPGKEMISISDNSFLKYLYLLHYPIQKKTMQYYEHIFAISTIEKRLLDNFLSKDKISFSPTGIDFNLFTPGDRIKSRMKLGLPENKTMILYVGRLSSGKGIIHLLDAFNIVRKQIRSAHLYIIGKGDFKEVIKQHINKEELSQQVHFLGHISQYSLPDYYRSANLTVMPSPFEWFGKVAVESMACGTPCIACNAGGAIDIIKEFECGSLIPPNNPTAIAEAIIEELSRKNPPIPNIERARLKFDWDEKLDHAFSIFKALPKMQ